MSGASTEPAGEPAGAPPTDATAASDLDAKIEGLATALEEQCVASASPTTRHMLCTARAPCPVTAVPGSPSLCFRPISTRRSS